MGSIDISKIKLSQLRAFHAVAKCENFSEAAATLNVSQSSVSHSIASMESELGVVLFTRGRHGATLTFVGEQIWVPVQQMLSLLDKVVEHAIASRSAQTGQVRIASIASLATRWLPTVIAQFNQQYEQITITVTKFSDHTEVQAALNNRSADIGLMDIYNPAGYSIVDIGYDPYVLLLPGDTLPPDQPATWSYLEQYPVIMPAPSDRGYDALREHVSRFSPTLNIAYEINEDAVIVSMVEQKLGVAILPYLAALPIPESVQVRQLPDALIRRLGAVVREDVLNPPAVFLFLDLVKRIGEDIFAINAFQ
ncbi:MAG: LysR family transcriptional regulator [Merismopedia sp. SIO2A8]|nr:LysR family transcriptional regulator [Merismopedia sp. SIO2A8]